MRFDLVFPVTLRVSFRGRFITKARNKRKHETGTIAKARKIESPKKASGFLGF
jgi:hypothetical protein